MVRLIIHSLKKWRNLKQKKNWHALKDNNNDLVNGIFKWIVIFLSEIEVNKRIWNLFKCQEIHSRVNWVQKRHHQVWNHWLLNPCIVGNKFEHSFHLAHHSRQLVGTSVGHMPSLGNCQINLLLRVRIGRHIFAPTVQ